MKIDSKTENKGNILLVDDIPDNLHLLSDLLTKQGYIVRSVTSGKMALKTVKVKRPDVIFLDIKMPEMDGYQVCEKLKSDDELQTIPIIFISALDDVFDKVKAFNSGGADYITKPFHVEEVVARLENQIIIQRQKRLLEEEVNNRRQTEEVLYQSRALLASVLNSSLDGVAAMQAVRNPETGDIEDFRCLVVNPIIARVFQRNREDMIGKLVLKKFLMNIEPELFNQFVDVVETGEPLERDFHYPSDNGAWYHFVAVKLGDGFSISIRDITSRKNIELALKDANNKLEELANLDGLTKVANRYCFNNRFQQEWQKALINQQEISLILLDIDYFKLYNDNYGHLSGDDCLFKVAQEIYKFIRHQDMNRPIDLVARYGGEEFVILLPNTNLIGAIQVASRIKEVVSNLAIPHQHSQVKDKDIVTVSLGVASLIPTQEIQPQTLISYADKALYHAKKQGRDRYCTYN